MEKIRNLKFFVLLMLVFVSITLYAYENGDYMAIDSGYWKTKGLWIVYQNGMWFYASDFPDENCNGTIYIPEDIDLYIAKDAGQYGYGESITIKKKLVVDGVLLASAPNSHDWLYGIINLEGDLEVDGRIGTRHCYYAYDPEIILNCYGSTDVNEIYGDGEMHVNEIRLYSDYNIGVYSGIHTIKFYNSSISCTLKDYNMSLEYLYVNENNTTLLILNNLFIRKSVYVDGGNSFYSAPTLFIGAGGELKLANYNENTKIFLGKDGHYAKLFVEGEYYNKAMITKNAPYPWELSYSPPAYPWLSGGEKVMISARNAVFNGMGPKGLLIKGGVKINNDKFNFCTFSNSNGNNPILLKLEGKSRNLTLLGCTFSNNRGYNVYKTSRLGTVNARYCIGSRSGEQYDYDTYNTVNWNRNRDDNKDNQEEELNKAKVILSNYPNPFNPTTTISYNLPKSGKISLAIYNLKGEKVKDLLKNQVQPEGIHKVTWDGKDTYNKDVSSGTYIYKLRLNNNIYNGQMSLLK